MSYHTFNAKCPQCGEEVDLGADDSDGPFTEIWGECWNCNAELTRPVTWWYEYETNGPVTVKASA